MRFLTLAWTNISTHPWLYMTQVVFVVLPDTEDAMAAISVQLQVSPDTVGGDFSECRIEADVRGMPVPLSLLRAMTSEDSHRLKAAAAAGADRMEISRVAAEGAEAISRTAVLKLELPTAGDLQRNGAPLLSSSSLPGHLHSLGSALHHRDVNDQTQEEHSAAPTPVGRPVTLLVSVGGPSLSSIITFLFMPFLFDVPCPHFPIRLISCSTEGGVPAGYASMPGL